MRLVVVTKGHPLEVAEAAAAAGARILGENYAEEAEPKIAALAGADVEWHMIGHVQSRKAGLVVANFDMVHSLDRVKLARRLDAAGPVGPAVPLPVMVQVNVSGEESKSGLPAWDRQQWPAVLELLHQVHALPNLRPVGLMTVPPYLPPEEARPFFRRLVTLQAYLQQADPSLQIPELSMGMSGDFEVAIEEGATYVRIGTAILGPR